MEGLFAGRQNRGRPEEERSHKKENVKSERKGNLGSLVGSRIKKEGESGGKGTILRASRIRF